MLHFLRVIAVSLFFVFFLYGHSYSLSKKNIFSYTGNNISNYFSGIISINQNNTSQALEFFKKVQPPQDDHLNFNIQFLRTLILLEKYNKAFNYVEKLSTENSNFTEANLLFGIKHFINEDYLNAEKYFKKIKKYENGMYYLEIYFSDFLIAISKAAQNDKMASLESLDLIPDSLNNLKKIQVALLHCHFDSPLTPSLLKKLVTGKNNAFSRYYFFLTNYYIYKNNITQAQAAIHEGKEKYYHNILVRQTDDFLLKKDYKKIKFFFNCRDSKDLMAEFFYIIANLHSSEENYILSNFYLKLSLFLNKNFDSNKSLLAENFFEQGNINEAKKIYFSIKKIGDVYSWYATKKIAYIISEVENSEKAVNYLKKEISRASNLTDHSYYDLANFFKSNEDYEGAVKYYTKALEKLPRDHHLIPKILDRRGSSYERLGAWKEAEEDLKKSLELSPDQPYVLNYLAYSWLERKININESLNMLSKANNLKQNDGYITDSLGWAFYLTKNYEESEILLRQAIELMPFDPIINDHYGDVLWRLNKKIQARYFWNHALSFEKNDKKFIDKINKKLIFGIRDKS